ncbi:homoserine dehydrogenase [Pediococcus ethanolidurans]
MTTISVGMLGCGTVGTGVLTLLNREASQVAESLKVHFSVKKIAVKHPDKKRTLNFNENVQFTGQIENVTTDPSIQIIIEVMGTLEQAYQAIYQAITNGKSVITANKELIALRGPQLTELARQNHVDLYYEASVGGGIPILRVLSDSLITDQISGLTGIVNGTSNYVLSAMKNEHSSYEKSLKQAQKLGYAEANPTNDVEGFDAAYKLAILSQLAFGHAINLKQLNRCGIQRITTGEINGAAALGLTLKPAIVARKKGQTLFTLVGPVAVTKQHPLANINGVENSILVTSAALGTTSYTGPGAGSEPTANSIMSDLLTVTHHLLANQSGISFNAPSNKIAEHSLLDLSLRYFVVIKEVNEPNFFREKAKYFEKIINIDHTYFCVTTVLTKDQRIELGSNCKDSHFYPLLK